MGCIGSKEFHEKENGISDNELKKVTFEPQPADIFDDLDTDNDQKGKVAVDHIFRPTREVYGQPAKDLYEDLIDWGTEYHIALKKRPSPSDFPAFAHEKQQQQHDSNECRMVAGSDHVEDDEDSENDDDLEGKEDLDDDEYIVEVETAVEDATEEAVAIENSFVEQITSMLDQKIVIQIQIYGLGSFMPETADDDLEIAEEIEGSKEEVSIHQFAVILSLIARFKRLFPGLSIRSHDPSHSTGDISYLKSHSIDAFISRKFSYEYFKTVDEDFRVSNSVALILMIHPAPKMVFEFLQANYEHLSKFILVTMDLRKWKCPEYDTTLVEEYFKRCSRIQLKFADKSIGYDCFSDTWVYAITDEKFNELKQLYP